MIRLILVALFLLVFFILSIPVFLIEWIIGKINPGMRDISSLRIVQCAVRIICLLAGIKLNVIGKENIPTDTPVLYVGNHRSYFDVVIAYSLMPGLTGFVGKKELEKIPFLATWMRFLHCHFLDRADIRQGLKTILAAIEDVKNGFSIFIFPEGTRGEEASDTELLPFHEGSFKVSTKSGCPIVPVSFNHTSEIFEDHMPWIKKTHVTVEFLKPVYPKELSREEQKFLGKHVQDMIADTLKRNE